MVLCFKLYFIKDATICTTAAATVRQMVSVIFERVVTEDSQGLGKKFHLTFIAVGCVPLPPKNVLCFNF